MKTAFFINIGRGITTRLDDLAATLQPGEIACQPLRNLVDKQDGSNHTKGGPRYSNENSVLFGSSYRFGHHANSPEWITPTTVSSGIRRSATRSIRAAIDPVGLAHLPCSHPGRGNRPVGATATAIVQIANQNYYYISVSLGFDPSKRTAPGPIAPP
jgi:hypothetical protein